MRRKTKLMIILIILSITICGIIALVVFASQKNDSVIAKVNGQKIYKSELDQKLTTMFQNQGVQKTSIEDFPVQVIQALAQDIYVQKQLDSDANKSPIANNKDIKNKVSNYKKELTRQAYLDYLTKEQVGEQAIKDRYDEISKEVSGKKEVHLKHILVATQKEAQDIFSSLKNNKSSFDKIAEKLSIDKSSSSFGGDLGYVIPEKLDKDFADKVMELKKDQISDPIKTKFGWHIVQLKDTRDADLPEFEKVKDVIEENLKQEILENVFEEITKDAKVEVLIEKKKSDKEEVSQEEVELKSESKDEAKK